MPTTSFLKPFPWKLSLAWFACVLALGLCFGPSDDEAYYWVLSQRPAWGYAFHPPMVAWITALFDGALPWPVVALRAAAAAGSAVLLGLALSFAGDSVRARLSVLSFAGLFGLAWMMVPDQPLLVGISLAFVATVAAREEGRVGPGRIAMIGAGVALAALSKFSGVAVAASAALAPWLPGGRLDARDRRAISVAALAALVLVLAPLVDWNLEHGWGSLLYQIRGRHGGSEVSVARYARFWAIQLALAGPVIVWMGFRAARGRLPGGWATAAFVLPPLLVFGMQPLGSEFKSHWIFAAWWPAAVAWAREAGERVGPAPRAWRAQWAWGLFAGALLWTGALLPIGSWAQRLRGVAEPDPRWDLAQDLRGWEQLPALVAQIEREHGVTSPLPVVGRAYQTASQASVALAGDRARVVAWIPRERAADDEWPAIPELAPRGQDGGWPALTRPVIFVGDERYSAGPEFEGAVCDEPVQATRRWLGSRGKAIFAQYCRPSSGGDQQ